MSTSGRGLKELLVVDLRRELGQRDLDVSGTKAALVERLRKALIDANEDPDSWQETVSTAVLEPKTAASVAKKTSSYDESNDQNVIDGDGKEKKQEECLENKSSSDSDDVSKANPAGETSEELGVARLEEDVALSMDKTEAKSCNEPNIVAKVESTEKEGECLAGINEDEAARDETKACSRASSPANDCSLVVGTAGGTSDLDRELSSFSEAKQLPSQSKVSCTRVPNPSERKAHKCPEAEKRETTSNGDNKRTEEIIADGKKAASKPKSTALSKIAVTNSKIKLISSGRVSTVNDPLRKTHRSDSQFRRDSAALERKAQVAERRIQRAIVMEHQLRRREQEVRRNEAKVIELERQLQAKIKELEVEREVIRDARGRLSRDQSAQAAKEAELREYEMRLVKAEGQLRISQEQQQKYYESQRIRQQKMAAYDDELRKRRQDLNQQQQRQAGNRRSASGHAVGATQPFPRRRIPVGAPSGQREPSPATRPFRREPAVSTPRHVDSDGRYWASAGPGDRRAGGRYWQDPESASSTVNSRSWQATEATPGRVVRDGNHPGYPAVNAPVAASTAMARTSGGGRPDFTPSSSEPESAPPNKRMKKSFDYRRTRYENPIGGQEASQNAGVVQSTGGVPGMASRAAHHGMQQESGQDYQPNWRQANSPVLRQMPPGGGPYGAGRVASSDGQPPRRYVGVNDRFDAYRSMVGQMAGKSGPGNTAAVLSALTGSSRGPYPPPSAGGSSHFPVGNARQRF